MRTRKQAKRASADLFDGGPVEDVPFESCALTGTHCAECGEPQRATVGGACCANGHGGAPALEDTRAPVPGVSPSETPPRSVKVSTRVGTVTARVVSKVMLIRTDSVPLIEISDPRGGTADVGGAIVKLSPVIKASERAGFDGAGVVRSLRERGALAVMFAPRVVPDARGSSKREESIRRAHSPEAMIRAWFDTAPGLNDEQRAEATRRACSIYEAALAAGR